jgi:hypothetical protein
MPNRRWLIAVVLALLATHAGAQTTQPDAAAEAAYTADITKRADDAIKFAGIDDAKAPAVRQTLVSQYRNLRTIHDARDAKLKAASDDAAKTQIKSEADASLKKLHDEFVTKLSSELPAEQVEKVKDKLTYNVVNVTYNAYCDELPQLTDSQKTYILAQLKEAREIAMDQGSSKDKHAVFGKYKGRINNYLAREGYDLKKAEKEWAQRRKAREASAKQTAQTPEQKPQKQD